MIRSLILSLLAALPLLAAPKTPAELDAHLRNLAPDLVDATIAIFLNGGSGSGVIVSPSGLVITAAHVTGKPGEKIKVLLADGRELPATSLGVDHTTDGALLQINAPGPFPFRPYVREKTYHIGDWAIAVGHPGGPVVGRPSPLRLGRITAAGIGSGFADPIITSAPVISGDSGGPLYNLDGEVIGINSNISMPWTANKHVPLPCIIEKWDLLMEGELIGQPTNGQMIQSEEPFDDPYYELRKKFLEALDARPADDQQAAALRARPRLLDPHHMQEFLDQWAPDEDALLKPSLGLRLDLTAPNARIAQVLPGTPAAQAGLKKGDTITAFNDTPVTSPTTFALALRKLEFDPTAPAPVTLTRADGSTLTLTPATTPERRHFPMPVAGVIAMMITGDPGEAPPALRDIQNEFLAPLANFAPSLHRTVLPIYHDGDLLVHATAVTTRQLITKASEIEKKENLVLRFEDQDYPVTIISLDSDRDLALISSPLADLDPISLRASDPETGTLVFTPAEKGLVTGVITQPARSAPATGYEHNVEPDQPSGYIGISFSPENIEPTVSRVELGSPADTAGLLEGDVITHFERKEMTEVDQLIKALGEHSPGEKVTFKIKRDDKVLTISLILDIRPPVTATQASPAARMRDQSLSSLSARGGKLSERRNDFPLALYHDQLLPATHTGTPLLNHKGEVLGINIARSLRHRTLAIPVSEILLFYREQLRSQLRTD
ncbi:MAG: trypsin-like peptidase domain-containing protein [Verrucomicrobiaceae bacterium]